MLFLSLSSKNKAIFHPCPLAGLFLPAPHYEHKHIPALPRAQPAFSTAGGKCSSWALPPWPVLGAGLSCPLPHPHPRLLHPPPPDCRPPRPQHQLPWAPFPRLPACNLHQARGPRRRKGFHSFLNLGRGLTEMTARAAKAQGKPKTPAEMEKQKLADRERQRGSRQKSVGKPLTPDSSRSLDLSFSLKVSSLGEGLQFLGMVGRTSW